MDPARGPRLRSVEAFPVEAGGAPRLALRDPSGLAERVLLVPLDLVPILARLDGRHTVGEIEAWGRAVHGERFGGGDLSAIVELLDREYFLHSPAFDAHKAARTAAYRAEPYRRAAHAGVSYPADPGPLAARLEGFEREAAAVPSPDDGTLVAIVAPPIDLRVGGATYVPAYRALAAAGGADLAVVLGVAHGGIDGHFAVSTRDFATPLGVARTDRGFAASLGAAFGEDLAAEELVHLTDHTVEFQVLFLQRFLGPACRIAPLLCSFGHAEVAGCPRGTGARIERLASALAETVAARRARGERVVLVASADLAHVGPRYGDPAPFAAPALRDVERADRELLGAVEAADPAAFLSRVAADGDPRRICGFSPVYAVLLAAGARRGRLLAYGQGNSDARGSVVSYASLALYG